MSEQWAIVELMGHRKLVGRVSEVERYGSKMPRIDVPLPGGEFATQFYGGSAVYCESPTTEEVARAYAERYAPKPACEWDLQKLLPPRPEVSDAPW